MDFGFEPSSCVQPDAQSFQRHHIASAFRVSEVNIWMFLLLKVLHQHNPGRMKGTTRNLSPAKLASDAFFVNPPSGEDQPNSPFTIQPEGNNLAHRDRQRWRQGVSDFHPHLLATLNPSSCPWSSCCWHSVSRLYQRQLVAHCIVPFWHLAFHGVPRVEMVGDDFSITSFWCKTQVGEQHPSIVFDCCEGLFAMDHCCQSVLLKGRYLFLKQCLRMPLFHLHSIQVFATQAFGLCLNCHGIGKSDVIRHLARLNILAVPNVMQNFLCCHHRGRDIGWAVARFFVFCIFIHGWSPQLRATLRHGVQILQLRFWPLATYGSKAQSTGERNLDDLLVSGWWATGVLQREGSTPTVFKFSENEKAQVIFNQSVLEKRKSSMSSTTEGFCGRSFHFFSSLLICKAEHLQKSAALSLEFWKDKRMRPKRCSSFRSVSWDHAIGPSTDRHASTTAPHASRKERCVRPSSHTSRFVSPNSAASSDAIREPRSSKKIPGWMMNAIKRHARSYLHGKELTPKELNCQLK